MLVALLVLLTGCAADEPTAAPDRPDDSTGASVAPELQRYVALGDSYTAAPGVPLTDVADGCFRSDGNYPALVAGQLDAELVDVSCSGADTTDVTDRQLREVPPQERALTADTDLVTVGLGGNDGGVFQQLVSRCRSVAPAPGETEPTGETCPPALDAATADRIAGTIDQTADRLAEVFRLVQRRAPQAQVLAVGYPQIVAPERRCDAIPLAESDHRAVVRLAERLNDAVQRAAEETGVDFLDVDAATRGHDICAEDPWVNGIVSDQRRALAFHPFAEGQQAVAELVLDAVRAAD